MNSARDNHDRSQERPYDALLVVSFGGPEGMDDVLPFLENVLRGRNVPRDRMLSVAKHYELFGGISPINEQNRKLIAALKDELDSHGPQLPIYFGNRNWHPMLTDTMKRMTEDGITNALAFVTSAYSSYSSCRQYREDIQRACEAVGDKAPRTEKLRPFYNHPNFIEANAQNVQRAFEQVPDEKRANTAVVFTAHSIPASMAVNCDYEHQLRETARLVAERVAMSNWRLAFQSRSGPPTVPWLEPDICDALRELRAEGKTDVVISPIGFVSDHMEIVYDLDTEAVALCREIGLNMIRAATAGTHPLFISMIRDLMMERIDPKQSPKSIGADGPRSHVCAETCCLPTSPR